jgi:hypothetical protein
MKQETEGPFSPDHIPFLELKFSYFGWEEFGRRFPLPTAHAEEHLRFAKEFCELLVDYELITPEQLLFEPVVSNVTRYADGNVTWASTQRENCERINASFKGELEVLDRLVILAIQDTPIGHHCFLEDKRPFWVGKVSLADKFPGFSDPSQRS